MKIINTHAPIPRPELGDGTVVCQVGKDENGRSIITYSAHGKNIILYAKERESLSRFFNREFKACKVFGELP